MKLKKGYLFVFFQFAFFILIFITGPNIPSNFFLFGLFLIGIIIALIGIWNMRVSKFRTNPEVAEGSVLITNGIYKFIRHPMYLGLILIALSLILDYLTFLRIVLLGLLVINQILKLNYEEKLLGEHFSEYKEYEKKTKKLIPYIY